MNIVGDIVFENFRVLWIPKVRILGYLEAGLVFYFSQRGVGRFQQKAQNRLFLTPRGVRGWVQSWDFPPCSTPPPPTVKTGLLGTWKALKWQIKISMSIIFFISILLSNRMSVCVSVCDFITQKRQNQLGWYLYCYLHLGPGMVLGLKKSGFGFRFAGKSTKTVLVWFVSCGFLQNDFKIQST